MIECFVMFSFAFVPTHCLVRTVPVVVFQKGACIPDVDPGLCFRGCRTDLVHKELFVCSNLSESQKTDTKHWPLLTASELTHGEKRQAVCKSNVRQTDNPQPVRTKHYRLRHTIDQ